MSADSTTRATGRAYPAATIVEMGALSARRWLGRLLVLAALAGLVAVLRERRLAQNAERYGLPG